jgi:hypothetical protein
LSKHHTRPLNPQPFYIYPLLFYSFVGFGLGLVWEEGVLFGILFHWVEEGGMSTTIGPLNISL